MEKGETAELADWLRRLDAESTEVAEDAKFEGIHRGEPVIGPLVEALPKLGSYAQLSAIEIFEEVPDEHSHPALIQLLLASESSTVRDWAATALAHLQVHKAIPALWQAHATCRRRGIPPECTEPSAIRHALTRLGARTAVMPALTASLRVPNPYDHDVWPTRRLTTVINELADHDQVVLWLTLWDVHGKTRYHRDHDTLWWRPNWDKPWPELVEEARKVALIEATKAPNSNRMVVTMDWISESALSELMPLSSLRLVG